MSVNDPADNSPDSSNGSAETPRSETGTPETPGSETGSDSGSPGETETSPTTPEETRRNIVVSSVGNPGYGQEVDPPKKRRGRPPGSKNAKPGVQTRKQESSIFGIPCTPAEAAQNARIALKLLKPAYNGPFVMLGKPILQPDELRDMYDAIYECELRYGDPLSKYWPLIQIIIAATSPVMVRVTPPEWGGMKADGTMPTTPVPEKKVGNE